jgi:PAS domain S-box-containing protein
MKGCFLRVNPAFAAALGYTAKELVETPFLNFVHSDDTAATLVEMEKLSSGTPTVQFENRYRCKDGSWKWLSWKTQPSLEEGLLYVTARDITESKRAAGRLAKSGAASDAANLAKSQFLANMSHEIRTPLTAILGYTDLMSDPEQTPGDRLDCVEIIRHSGDHLLTIINDILDISKIEAGEMQLERISCSPCQILNDIASTMRARAKEKGLKFEVSSTGPIPETIHSDPTRLRQIIFNLVGNAIKFTESGWVRVAMKLEGADSASPRLRFEVTDSGIGIGAENLNHLFRPFSQADSSTTRRFGGSGLGLFISRRLAQMLGGDISVDTQIGRGSLFSVGVETGPLSGVKMLADFSEALTPTETPIGATTLKLTGRILLAEDSVVNQRLLSYYLRREGADVDVAGDGAAARDMALQAMFEGASYDLILMDMQMPKLDGYAASAQLRSKGYKGAIVALTAHAMATDRQKCLKSGCDDYLSKPATRAALIEMARRYLAGRQSAPVVAIAPQGVIHRMTPEGVDDDVIRDFLPEFLAGLPEKVCRLQILLQESDHKGMAALLHSIKGSSGLYGFAKLMELAGQTEESVLHESSFASIQEQVRSLITMIRSIEGYDPQREALAHQTDWKVGPS